MGLQIIQQPNNLPTPGDENSFRRKLINIIIAVLMVLCEISRYYNWPDGVTAIELVKWCFELIALFL
jgi:hypothetical protein